MTETINDEPSATGHHELDAALSTLADLAGRPVSEHVEIFESAHERFRDVLSGAGHADQG